MKRTLHCTASQPSDFKSTYLIIIKSQQTTTATTRMNSVVTHLDRWQLEVLSIFSTRNWILK